MAYLPTEILYTGEGIQITKRVAPAKGRIAYSYIRETGPHNFQVCSKGSMVILDAEGNHTGYTWGKGEVFRLSNYPEMYSKGEIVIGITVEPFTGYCINDFKDSDYEWLGESYFLPPNQSKLISCIKGDRLFFTEDCMVQGNKKPAHTLITISKDVQVLVEAEDVEVTCCRIYRSVV